MPTKLKLYTGIIIVLGLSFVFSEISNITPFFSYGVLFFMVLGVITESLNVRMKESVAISISFAIGLATVFIFKSCTIAALLGFTTMLFSIEPVNGKVFHLFNSSVYKRLFNGSAYAISLALSSIVYNVFDSRYTEMRLSDLSIPGIVATILVYAAVNATIFMLLTCILENKRLIEVFRDIKWPVVNIIGLSPLGVITAIAYKSYGWFAVILFFGPLLLARYSFKLYIDMKHVYFETIKALSNAMEAKDEYTKGHSYRVAGYAMGIAKQMQLRQDRIDRIETAAILHDIGKIGISDTILNKPDKLLEEEFLEIKRHPEIGAKILSEVGSLKEVAQIIRYHHEHYDGKGYPENLEGEDIPIESCILAVADAFDAMTSDRPYRKAMDTSVALGIIEEEAGKQFHPLAAKCLKDFLKTEESRCLVAR